MIGRLLLLIFASLACWVLVALPARALLDDPEQATRVITYSGTCLALCVLPGTLTLWWARRSLADTPDLFLMAALGGTGLRLFSVLLAAWLLVNQVPFYRHGSFWMWLLLAYLYTLTLELILLLTGRPVSAPRP